MSSDGAVRPTGRSRVRRLLVGALAAVTIGAVLPACGLLRPPGPFRFVYDATVVRTPYGIPHVTARDWGSLGYGYGYAYSQDNFCALAQDVVLVNGEMSRYFGPTGDNLNTDFYYTGVKDSGEVEQVLASPSSQGGPSPTAKQLVRGYAAGYNRYLHDVGGVNHIPDPRCRGAAWVRPITETDLWLTYHRTAGYASATALLDPIVAAQPPVVTAAATAAPTAAAAAPPDVTAASLAPLQAALEQAGADAPGTGAGASGTGDGPDLFSNGIGLGRDATQNADGMLLANPHFPWDGPQRFYEAQLTIPGVYDMVGASIVGNPIIEIGHNQTLAWTHTVSTAMRFTLSALTLVPGDPTSYFVDGVPQKMTSQTVTIQVRQPDGTLAPATHTFWRAADGLIVSISPLGWTPQMAIALHDVNEKTANTFDNYIAMGESHTVHDLQGAIGRYQGLPWINTLAADSTGEAYYGDNSIVPHLTDAEFAACSTPLSALVLSAGGAYLTDGARSACEWGSDADAARPGIFGPSELPQLFRSDYVTNSNDSYWLANPAEPLTGFPRIIGNTGTARSLRTRLGLTMVQQRLAGTDGLPGTRFTRDDLQADVFNDRIYGGELTRDALVGACRAHPSVVVGSQTVDLTQACDVLAGWDLKANLDSRGEILFREFANAGGLNYKLFSVPFDVSDPVNTPNTLDASNPAVLQALGAAVLKLQGAGIPLDAATGAVQTEHRGSEVIPIHGGTGTEGAFNVISDPFQGAAGYPQVTTGSSFVMVAELGPNGPKARAVLTYSQSTNPDSPHYTDQTWLYSQKQWVDLPYTRAEVARAAVSRLRLVGWRAPGS